MRTSWSRRMAATCAGCAAVPVLHLQHVFQVSLFLDGLFDLVAALFEACQGPVADSMTGSPPVTGMHCMGPWAMLESMPQKHMWKAEHEATGHHPRALD